MSETIIHFWQALSTVSIGIIVTLIGFATTLFGFFKDKDRLEPKADNAIKK